MKVGLFNNSELQYSAVQHSEICGSIGLRALPRLFVSGATAVLVCLTFLSTSPAAGESSLPDLVPAPLVAEALRSNPRLQAMQASWEAMQERPAQAGALPNPMLTYRGMDISRSGSFPDTNEKRYELEQAFPWFGKRDLRRRLAVQDADAMKSDVATMTREITMLVKETYYGLYSVQKATSITRGEKDLLSQIIKITETKYSTGESGQQDLRKAQSELTMVSQRLLDLESQQSTLKARLNTLLNRDPSAPLGNAIEPPPADAGKELEALLELAQKQRPEISGARIQVERSLLERKLMGKEYMPDMKLGAEYRSFKDGSDDMAMFMVGLEIPLWQGKYKAGTRETDKMIESSRATEEAIRKQTAFEVKDIHFKVLTAKRSVELYRSTLIPQALLRFQASESAYRTGKSDFMDLLESERFLLNAKIMLAMVEGDLGMNLARLERAIGTEPSSGQHEVQNAK